MSLLWSGKWSMWWEVSSLQSLGKSCFVVVSNNILWTCLVFTLNPCSLLGSGVTLDLALRLLFPTVSLPRSTGPHSVCREQKRPESSSQQLAVWAGFGSVPISHLLWLLRSLCFGATIVIVLTRVDFSMRAETWHLPHHTPANSGVLCPAGASRCFPQPF